MTVDRAWRQQSVWSQVAGRLKRDVKRSRTRLLALTAVGALLASLAVVTGLDSPLGKVCAFLGALSVAVAGIIRPRTGQLRLRDWTRARSASEAIKSEVFLYLTGSGEYGDVASRDETLAVKISAIERDVDDLLPQAQGIEPSRRELPKVHDVDSYTRERVEQQITKYYTPQAADQQRLLKRAHAAEIGLALLGAALAAAAGTWGLDAIAVWVPVVTTFSAAVTAHAAAERYEYLVVEYLRTAAELNRLRDRRGTPGGLSDGEFIRACEHVISVQNEGWMAKLTGDGA